MLGVTLRITITEDGSDGMSFLEDIVKFCAGGGVEIVVRDFDRCVAGWSSYMYNYQIAILRQ